MLGVKVPSMLPLKDVVGHTDIVRLLVAVRREVAVIEAEAVALFCTRTVV